MKDWMSAKDRLHDRYRVDRFRSERKVSRWLVILGWLALISSMIVWPD